MVRFVQPAYLYGLLWVPAVSWAATHPALME